MKCECDRFPQSDIQTQTSSQARQNEPDLVRNEVTSSVMCHPYDTIVCCELVYDEDAHAALCATLVCIFTHSPSAVCHLAFIDRPFSQLFLVHLADSRLPPTQQSSSTAPFFSVRPITPRNSMLIDELQYYAVTRSSSPHTT
uniref:Uncharacterized protein n=1 Tax=Erythrolobus madagascarensis TaxID=708628 RepID=A0A7S0XLZ4_9RHOD